MSDYAVFIEGIEDINLDRVKGDIAVAASRAINKASDHARALGAREMMRQVNFPASYLRGENSRLNVTQRATKDRLEGVVTGRRRPTSLARFVNGVPRRGQPVSVTVHPGSPQQIGRAFLMKLRAGDTGRLGNMGLAIRVPKGTRPKAAYKPVRIADGLFLLYGPSVDQVFKSVRGDIAPAVESYLAAEFNRLLDLKL